MKKGTRDLGNLLFASLLLSLIFFSKELLPVTSSFFRSILIYLIWFFIIFIGLKSFNKDRIKDFGFTFKTKLPKKVINNARLIGLLIGIISNLMLFYSIDIDDYLKGFNILEKISLALILGPISEEIVFRGYIQTVLGFALVKYKKQKIFWLPIIATSLIFGLLHFTAIARINFLQTLGVVIMAISLGIFSGYYKEKYKSLIPSINMHIATNLGAMVIAAFLLLISPSDVPHKIFKRMNQPTYNFDMNDSAAFTNSLIDFSIYEKNTPDSLIGKIKNISIKIYLTVDTSGKIAVINLDTIRNMRPEKSIINPDFYKENALTIAKKLPRFIPPGNLRKDTTIVFYVAY